MIIIINRILRVIKNVIGLILFLASIGIAGLLPYEHIFYMFQKPTSAESSVDVGLPAGENVLKVETTEEMKRDEYFTFQTDSLTPTGIYCIIDEMDGGTITVSSRRSSSTWTVRFYTTSKLDPIIHKLTYGQFYIASMPSGENVVILINDALLSTSGSKLRTLPVGEIKYMPSGSRYDGNYIENYFKANSEKYGLGDNTSQYVHMVSSSFKDTYKTPIMIIMLVLTFVIAGVLLKILDKIFKRFGVKEED